MIFLFVMIYILYLIIHIMTKNNTVTKKLLLFVGDGDSSVTKRLVDCQPYGLNFNIRKMECKNHLMRNYASKLTTLARNTKYPLRVRKFILANIMRFRSDVQKTVLHWKKKLMLHNRKNF